MNSKKNPIADLCELTVQWNIRQFGKIDTHIYLQLGATEMEYQELNYSVSIKELFVGVHIEGMDIIPDSKFGLDVKKPTEKRTIHERRGEKNSREYSGNAKASAGSNSLKSSNKFEASGKGEVSHKKSVTVTSEQEDEVLDRRVIALGGNKWRIRELKDGDNLGGMYINGQVLASFDVVPNSNRKYMQVVAFSRQRDFRFVPLDKKLLPFRERAQKTAKNRIIDILKSKFLSNELNADVKYEGLIQLSMDEYLDE